MVFLFPYAGFTQLKKTTWSNNQDFVPGTIVIKVKEGIGPFEKQERSMHFGIASLDEKANKFNVNKLAKRFIHKPIPKKLRSAGFEQDIPDSVSQITKCS